MKEPGYLYFTSSAISNDKLITYVHVSASECVLLINYYEETKEFKIRKRKKRKDKPTRIVKIGSYVSY